MSRSSYIAVSKKISIIFRSIIIKIKWKITRTTLTFELKIVDTHSKESNKIIMMINYYYYSLSIQ